MGVHLPDQTVDPPQDLGRVNLPGETEFRKPEEENPRKPEET
jgi:hypothetical protein